MVVKIKKIIKILFIPIFLTRSSIFFLDFGTKPKKTNSDIGNPDNCKLDTIDEGPGTDVTLILFAIQYCTKLYPGSEISGEPASEIRTQFLFSYQKLLYFLSQVINWLFF